MLHDLAQCLLNQITCGAAHGLGLIACMHSVVAPAQGAVLHLCTVSFYCLVVQLL